MNARGKKELDSIKRSNENWLKEKKKPRRVKKGNHPWDVNTRSREVMEILDEVFDERYL